MFDGNWCSPPDPSVADAGEIVTLTTAAGVMVTCAEADFVGSACDTAVTVTVAGFGTTAGAERRSVVEVKSADLGAPRILKNIKVIDVFHDHCSLALTC